MRTVLISLLFISCGVLADTLPCRSVRISSQRYGLLCPDGWVGDRFWRETSFAPAHGLWLVQDIKTHKYGFVDLQGAIKVPLEWDDASPFAEGFARVGKEGQYGLLDQQGKLAFKTRWEDITGFLGDLCPVKKGSKWGYMNRSGSLAIDPAWDDAKAFPVGIDRARVRTGQKWCYIDRHGKTIIPPTFDEARAFYGPSATVWNSGSGWQCIDQQGKPVTTETWKSCWDFPATGQPLCVVQAQSGRWGVIRPDGSYAIAPTFKWLGSFEDGYAMAATDDLPHCIVDALGKVIVAGDWDAMREPMAGFAIISKDGLEGYVEMATGRVIKPQWDHVEPFLNEVGLVFHEQRVALISSSGEVMGRWFDLPSAEIERPIAADRRDRIGKN